MSSFNFSTQSKSAPTQSFSTNDGQGIVQWKHRVTSAQRLRQSPESIAAAESRAQLKSRLKKNSSKAKRLQTVQAFAKCSNAGTMASLRSATRPSSGTLSFGSSVPMNQSNTGFSFGSSSSSLNQQQQQQQMSAAFGAAASTQTKEQAAERAGFASKAMASLQQAANVDDELEADQLIEEARQQLQSAGHAWTAFGVEGANEASRVLGDCNDSDEEGSNNEQGLLAELLSDLKSEPTDDEDCTRRFQLYEEHTETVSTVRKSLLTFWEGAKGDVPTGAAKEAIETSLVNIDHAENLELYINPNHWFVYSMARKVTANETKLGNVLRSIQTKLDLLASTEDCPICLESIDNKEDEHTFGCAHKVHKDCWAHWSTHCASNHKQPFCPLCRNDEFLEDILS